MRRSMRALAPNTRETYRSAWRGWRTWCEAQSVATIPAEPRMFVAWLESMVIAGNKRGHIENRFAVVSRIEWQGRIALGDEQALPLAKLPLVAGWLRAYRRESPGSNGAPLITMDELQRLLRAAELHLGKGKRVGGKNGHKGMSWYRRAQIARHRCMLLFSFYGAMRRSELLDLQLRDVERTDRGIAIHFRHSKTDQGNTGEVRDLLPQGDLDLCPVFAWDEWRRIDTREEPEAPAFCAMRSSELTCEPVKESTWYGTVKRLGKWAGVRVTPHSFRVAFATHAAELHEESEVLYHGRWKSRQVVERYIRRGRAWSKNPTSGLSSAGRSAPPNKSDTTNSD